MGLLCINRYAIFFLLGTQIFIKTEPQPMATAKKNQNRNSLIG